MIDTMKQRATDQLSSQKNKATDGLGSIAQIARQGTRQLRDQQHDTLAGYVERAADQIDRLSQQLRDKDVNELVNDAQRLARRRPALFIGAAFALGVIGARFFKSSSRDTRDDDVDRYPSPAYQSHRNDMSRTRVSSPGTQALSSDPEPAPSIALSRMSARWLRVHRAHRSPALRPERPARARLRPAAAPRAGHVRAGPCRRRRGRDG